MNIKIVYENRLFASIASINDLTGIINFGNGSQKVLKCYAKEFQEGFKENPK